MIRTAKTENGMVRGIEAADPRITAFKGIPFAAPPVGENRWRAPMPCENWEGVKDCSRFAPISMQDTPGLGTDIYCREWHVDPEIPMGEDCLYLNVWTGAKSADEKLPVVVWFFGGGIQWGYPSEMEFDGERMARRGIVVVTVNYRLGAFGFLAHPEITKNQPEAPSNFGCLDQQAGIKWVIRNISAFGGDPDNITIAGQSAGGGSVMAQMASPTGKGLFQKAIIQSAMIMNPYHPETNIGTPEPISSAEKKGEEFFAFLGVKTLEEARKLDAFYIRDKYGEFAQSHPRFFWVQDDIFCVGDPIRLIMENKHANVPMLAGNTADEFPGFIPAKDMETLEKIAVEKYGEKAKEFLAIPEVQKQNAEGFYAPVNGIECMVKAAFIRNKENGNDVPCYYYRFDADIPGWDNPGTFHSVELWFFFETLAKCWRPFKGAHYDLARQMCNYWVNFVKTGNPNGPDADGTPMPEWRPFTREDPFSMVFTTDGPVAEEKEENGLVGFLVEDLLEK